MKSSEKKTKLGQSLLKALKEILVSEGESRAKAGVPRQLIANDAQLKVTKDKIADLKDSLLERKNEAMNPELRKAARAQAEALIRELEESVRDYESSRSRD
ncbi:hypothetical protein [Bdellovibrio bacteriovorus]|uniref:hypothetical protein n=1 Tax=Bdellovibrio bacteriovorus TaxID=959 RepID=UPI003D079B4E